MAGLMTQVQGHNENKKLLQQAWEAGRWPSAFLFSGPSGVGKKAMAKAMIQNILCEKSAERACGGCGSCRKVAQEQSEHAFFVSSESGQIKAEKAQEVNRFLALQEWGKARFVVIDEAHLLNPQAGNALLKAIEEPPAKSYFILTTSNISAVLPTVRSRCQVLRFSPLSEAELRQIIKAEEWVYKAAQGRVDLAEWLQSDEVAELRSTGSICWQKLLNKKPVAAFEDLKDVLKNRESAISLVRLWQQWLRDAWLLKCEDRRIVHKDQLSLLEEISQQSFNDLEWFYNECHRLEMEFQGPIDKGLAMESFLRNSSERLGVQ